MIHSSANRVIELLLVLGTIGAALVMLAPRASGGPPSTQPDAPKPDPKLQPQNVVRIVITALSKNDANDNGIRTTWKFASPANQNATGPVERFIPMVKSAAYAPMLNSKSAQYGVTQVQGDQAVQAVLLTAADGRNVVYIFQLSRQTDGPLKECWMTDAVFPVVAQERPHAGGDDRPA
jgi:hypothetical protein